MAAVEGTDVNEAFYIQSYAARFMPEKAPANVNGFENL